MELKVEDLIGEWSGEMCRICGCELLENKAGDMWCSNIDCQKEFNKKEF